MAFEKELPKWENQGVEPPESKKATGWEAGEKPPADYFNWQWNRTYEALKELQEKAAEKVDVQQAQQTADNAATAAANAQSDIDDYKNEIRSLGLGIDVNPRTTENLDLEVQPGWVSTTPETVGIPPTGGHGVVRIDRRNENRVAQTYYHLSGAMETAFFTRVLGEAGWTDWVKVLHSGNTTDIVNQEYEVGSWTPVLRFGGSSSGISYASRAGRYIRIANVVYWSFSITLSSKGSASGSVEIAGLPFVGEPVFGHHHHSIGRAINVAEPKWLFGSIITGSIFLYTNDGSPFTSTGFANNSILQASGFYSI